MNTFSSLSFIISVVLLGGIAKSPARTLVEPASPTVSTASGALTGILENEVIAFKGIPYAQPPTGERRWSLPQENISWNDTRYAVTYGSDCLQPSDQGLIGNEDCLYLNVWTPTLTPNEPLAVMVFIHGGSFTVGSGTSYNGLNLYVGDKLAKNGNVVVVTLNYRLGPMGFLAHPAMTSINHGIFDQLAALRWVQRNIASFGGAKDNVTLFGQSAGGTSVCTLVSSSLARGLFHRAIIQSGKCEANDPIVEFAKGRNDAAVLGCRRGTIQEELQCLKELSGEQLFSALRQAKTTVNFGLLPYSPTIDGYVLKRQPLLAISKQEHNPIPIMIGTTKTEIPGVVYLSKNYRYAYESVIRQVYSDDASFKAISSYYSVARYGSYMDALAALHTHLRFTCIARTAALLLNKNQTAPVYSYVFDALGSLHGSEMPMVFQRLGIFGGFLEYFIGKYWSNFAKNGNPNGGFLTPHWPTYSMESRNLITLADPIAKTVDHEGAACDLLAKYSNPLE